MLDRLDALFGGSETAENSGALSDAGRDVQALRARVESANAEFYSSIRYEIQRNARPDLLLQSVCSSDAAEASPTPGLGYDALDELVTGVFQLEEPRAVSAYPDPEMVFYQPTPARHIFHLLRLAEPTASDTLIDLGAGLGHLPLLASICTPARCVGIEVEEAYVACARRCAETLNLERVWFVQEDARAADLSAGTIFYLYTPFRGTILAAVLSRLRREAETRPIRLATFGPCAEVVERESWLTAANPPNPAQISLFSASS